MSQPVVSITDLTKLYADVKRGYVALAGGCQNQGELVAAVAEDRVAIIAHAALTFAGVGLMSEDLIRDEVVEVELRGELIARTRSRVPPNFEVDMDRPALVPARVDGSKAG